MMNVPKPPTRLPHSTMRRPLGRPGAIINDISPRRRTLPRAAATQSVALPPQQVVSVTPPPPTVPQTKKIVKRQRVQLKKHALLLAAPFVIFICIRLSATPVIGEGLIVLYGLTALVMRIPARISFWLAAMALVSVGVALLLVPEPGRANNGALFVFLFLGVGLVSSVFETRRIATQSMFSRRR